MEDHNKGFELRRSNALIALTHFRSAAAFPQQQKLKAFSKSQDAADTGERATMRTLLGAVNIGIRREIYGWRAI